MIRRAHGLVERFKSRSDLMKIDPNPSGLLTGGHWDQLTQAVWDVFSSKAQTETTYESKISLWKNIFLYIRVSIAANCKNIVILLRMENNKLHDRMKESPFFV